MEIKRILTKEPWEKFVPVQWHAPFLQSWAWGEFQDVLGNEHFRLVVFEDDEPVGVAAAILMRRKLGSFLYVPHGPLLRQGFGGQALIHDEKRKRVRATKLLAYLKEVARQEGVDYLRVEPRWEDSEENRQILKDAGFRPAVSCVQVRAGWLLDLHPSEGDLLTATNETTRHLVSKAQEEGILVHRSRSYQDMAKFHRLTVLMERRQKITPQPWGYLQKQFETLAPLGMAELYLAEYEREILAGAIIISYGDTAAYVHAASVHSEVPAAYVLVWEAIRAAKKSGLDIFDFWGIAETNDRRHPWYGLSLFKKGFGGYRVDYLGAWDFPLTPRYLPVIGVERVRKLLRGY